MYILCETINHQYPNRICRFVVPPPRRRLSKCLHYNNSSTTTERDVPLIQPTARTARTARGVVQGVPGILLAVDLLLEESLLSSLFQSPSSPLILATTRVRLQLSVREKRERRTTRSSTNIAAAQHAKRGSEK